MEGRKEERVEPSSRGLEKKSIKKEVEVEVWCNSLK